MPIGLKEQLPYPEFISYISGKSTKEITDEICEYLKILYKTQDENAITRVADFTELEHLVKRYAFFLSGPSGIDDGEYNSSGVITTDQIGADAITAAEVADAVIAAEHIAEAAIEEAKIAADAVTAAKIAVAGLDGETGNVAANHIVAGMLQTGCVVTEKLYADAVTAPKINVVGLDGESGRIVVTDQTDADEVTDGINTHAVTLIQAGKILISGVTSLDVWSHGTDATYIDGGKVYANSITAAQIAAGSITVSKFGSDISMVSAGYDTEANMAQDASFEADAVDAPPTSGWVVEQGSPVIKAEASTATIGKQSCYFPGDGSNQRIISKQSFPVTPGQVIYGRIRAKGDADTAKMYFGLYYSDTTYDYFIENQNPGATWTTYQGSLTIPAGVTWAKIWVFNYTDNTGVLYADDVYVGIKGEWRHATDVTYIDGGKIYADSITADQIEAGTITADEIEAGTITADELILGQRAYWYSKVSTTTRNSNDATKSTASMSWVKIKEVKLNEDAGKMKIYFWLASAVSGTVYGRIRVNGEVTGDWGTSTEKSTTTAVACSDDLGPFEANDLIQIYAKCGEEEKLVEVQDMKFKYDRAVTVIAGAELEAPLTTDDQTVYSVSNQDPA